MSREFAIVAFAAIVLAEIGLRIAQMWEAIGRAACPCGGEL